MKNRRHGAVLSSPIFTNDLRDIPRGWDVRDLKEDLIELDNTLATSEEHSKAIEAMKSHTRIFMKNGRYMALPRSKSAIIGLDRSALLID